MTTVNNRPSNSQSNLIDPEYESTKTEPQNSNTITISTKPSNSTLKKSNPLPKNRQTPEKFSNNSRHKSMKLPG